MDEAPYIPQIDDETANYIIKYFPNLLTHAEAHAWRRLASTMKATKGRDDLASQETTLLDPYWGKQMPNDEEAVRLARHGWRHFARVAAARILAERRSEVHLNCCPKCALLARTPWARQCRFCGHDWHAKPNRWH